MLLPSAMKQQCSFEPKHNEMARHIASGIFNSGVVQTVRVLCQFGSVVILSRLLPPSDFGLMAMVSPVYGFVVLFQDLGLSQATIRQPQLTHGEVNAFFWINLAAGALLAALLVAASPLVGWYYGDPRVVPLTSAMALLILVGAAGNQPGAILTRRMEFGVAAWTAVLGAVAGLAISIIMALIIKNYWALYLGMAAGTIVPVAGVWIASGWMPSAPRHVSRLRDMLKFGAGVTTANVSSYFSMNTDNILIGWRWGEHVLGLYDRAYKLLLFPIARIIGPVMGTMVPVLSRLAGEPDRYREIFLKTIALLTLATWPGIVWAIVLKDSLIPTLLGRQWGEAASIFAPLALAGLVQAVNNSMGYLYITQGRSGELARMGLIGAAIDVASFALGLPYGAEGVATAYAISEFLRTPFFWWVVTSRGPIRARAVVLAILPQIAATLMSALVLSAYSSAVAAPPLVQLAGGLLLSYTTAALMMCVSAAGRQTLRYALEAGEHLLVHVRLKAADQAAAE
jgi:PST family polysaccharide transporter